MANRLTDALPGAEGSRTQLLELAFESMDHGVSVFDAELRFVLYNRRFLELLGIPGGRFGPGDSFRDFLRFQAERGEYGAQAAGAVAERLRLIESRRAHTLERTRPDGTVLDIRRTPIPGGGFLTTYTDVTAARRMQAQLRATEERQALIVEAMSEGVYEWTLSTNALYASDRLIELMRFPGDAELTAADWNERVHPEDYERYRQALVRYFKGETPRLECEYRIRDGHGEYRWVLDRAAAVRGTERRVERLLGAVADISALKATEEALRASEERYGRAMEAINESVYDWDLVADTIYYSPGIYTLLGQREHELRTPMDWLQRIHPDDVPAYRAAMRAHLRGETPRLHVEYRYRAGDGSWRWASQHGLALRDASGRAVRLVGSTGDVTERKELEVELERAREQALAANRAKSQFLANMSHELRTPLNAIIGLTEMLEEDARDDELEDYAEPLARIGRAGKHLLTLINDVLDLSKIEAERVELHAERCEVAGLIEEARSMAEPLAARNRNTLTVNLVNDPGVIETDITRLRQIVFNLLSNACKFTEDGTVGVEVERRDGEGGERLRVAVRDSGIGLAPAQIDRLFQDFSQADSSTTRKYGGTGLGLAISRRLARLMGGDITVASEPGVGSTFTLEIGTRLEGRRGEREAPPANDAPAREQRRTPVALVIDDDADARDLMRRFLARERFDVVTAGDGGEGLRLARELGPSVITLDVFMPEVDGWEVLQRLKADPLTRSIPVVMVTISEEKHRGYTLGAADYLTKPVDREVLGQALAPFRRAGGERRVLVVEDDPGTREVLRRTLEGEGWRVEEAADGRIGLARLERGREHPPDVVILDLMMPEMDGFELLRRLRKTAWGRAIPVVVLTAADLSAADRAALNGAVARVLGKGALGTDGLLEQLRALVTRPERGG